MQVLLMESAAKIRRFIQSGWFSLSRIFDALPDKGNGDLRAGFAGPAQATPLPGRWFCRREGALQLRLSN